MLNAIRLWLRTVWLRRRLDREMQEEMALHLERATERLMARGLTGAEARRAAMREFGNVDMLQEESRDARGARWLESLVADVRFGLRHFARTPLTTLTMIVLLALGIGCNSALFTFLYSMVRMPPPGIARDASLVRIRGIDHDRGIGRTVGREFSYPEYREYAARTDLFSAVAAWTSADVVLDDGGERNRLHSAAATYVTGNYFQVLGIRPVVGAGLPAAATAEHGAGELMGVISHALWDRHFGRAPDVVGRIVQVNDVAVTIVGVAPPRFAGARPGGSQIRVWLPLGARPLVQRTSGLALSSYDSAFFGVVARLRAGVAVEQTLPAVATIAARAAQQTTRGRGTNALSTDVVRLLGDNYFPPSGESPSVIGRAASLLMPLLILLIPCTNVSGLLVGLAVARRREIAVRLSLGAGRRRIVRQLITESVLLALAAGVLGVCVIAILLQVFGARVPDVQLALQWPVFVFTFACALATGILFGVSPALHATRVSVADVLKSAAHAVASARSRLQSGIVVVQIALTMPLLLGVGALLLELLSDVRRLPARGINDRIIQVSFNTNPRYGTLDAGREATLQRLQARFGEMPGVEAVVPQDAGDGSAQVAVHAADRIDGITYPELFRVQTRAAPPGYFALMGFSFVRGRGFERTDQENGRALVIRGDLARRLWGSADPIGRRLVHTAGGQHGAVAFVVVGVLDEATAGRSGDDAAHVFVPNLSRTGSPVRRTGSILVRTRGPAEPVIPLLRSVANAEAPLLPVTRMTTLAALDASQRSLFRKVSTGAAAAGFVALLLCAIGLYAVIAFAVGQRTREIGIRTALGAKPGEVVKLFFLRGVRLSLAGVIMGVALSAFVLRVATLAEGREMQASLLLLAGGLACTVIAIACVATWIPARRAATVDPLTMLHTE